MFRTNNFSSSGGLYKKLTVFYHASYEESRRFCLRYLLIYVMLHVFATQTAYRASKCQWGRAINITGKILLL